MSSFGALFKNGLLFIMLMQRPNWWVSSFPQDGQEQQQEQQPPRPSPWSVIKTLAVRMLFIYFIASMFRRSPTTPSNDTAGTGGSGVKPATNLFEKGTVMVGGTRVTSTGHGPFLRIFMREGSLIRTEVWACIVPLTILSKVGHSRLRCAKIATVQGREWSQLWKSCC